MKSFNEYLEAVQKFNESSIIHRSMHNRQTINDMIYAHADIDSFLIDSESAKELLELLSVEIADYVGEDETTIKKQLTPALKKFVQTFNRLHPQLMEELESDEPNETKEEKLSKEIEVAMELMVSSVIEND